MQIIHKIRPAVFLLLFIAQALAAQAQAPDSSATGIDPWLELRRLETTFLDTIARSFSITAFVETNPGTINATRDSTGGTGKMYNGKFWSWIDSTETLQDDNYNLTVYHKDSVAILANAMPITQNMFQLAIQDPTFYNLFVDSIKASDSGGLRKISLQFKPQSPYQRYEILFDTATYQIYRVLSELVQPSASYRVQVYCSNYQIGGFSDSFFSMDKFFTRQQAAYSMVAPYADYELINSLKQ